MTYRIVVCVDVDAKTPVEAYRKVADFMNIVPLGMEWESSDEWYDHNGTQMPEEVIQQCRMQVFAERGED